MDITHLQEKNNSYKAVRECQFVFHWWNREVFGNISRPAARQNRIQKDYTVSEKNVFAKNYLLLNSDDRCLMSIYTCLIA